MANVTSDENQAAHNSSSEDCRLTQPLLQKPESPVIDFIPDLWPMKDD